MSPGSGHVLRDLKPTGRASGVRCWTVLLLCVGTFLTAASLCIYVRILSPYAEMFGASLSLIGLIGGSYGFVQLLTRIPLGLLSDHGLRKPILVASRGNEGDGPAAAGETVSSRREQ